MKDDEFNFHRLVKIVTKVVQPALQDLFENLWNKEVPETLWAKNYESVRLFEQKADEHFQNSLVGLSTKETGKKKEKRNLLQSTFRDDNWKNYKWDTGKYVYALVHSKLFDLDETDEAGVQVSEHIVKIKEIRNDIVHLPTTYCDTNYFEKTFKSTEAHIKALKIKLNVSPYIEKLQKIKTDEKPVSNKVWYETKTQFEQLKCSQKVYEARQQVYEEREKTYLVQKELNAAEREKHSKELENERLRSENAALKQSNERLQSKNASLKQRLDILESIINPRKRRHSENLEEHNFTFRNQLLGHSAEFQKLNSEEKRVKKNTVKTSFVRCKHNGIVKAVIVIMMIWHQVKSK